MAFSTDFLTLEQKKFQKTVEHELQAMGGMLRPYVGTADDVVPSSDSCIVNRLKQKTAVRNTDVHADTPIGDDAWDRRWLSKNDYITPASLLAPEKVVQVVSDPSSEIMQAHLEALRRSQDMVIMSAFFGTARGEKEGDTSISFDTTNQVVAAGGAGLTVAKISQAVKIFRTNHIGKSTPIFMAVTPEDFRVLKNDVTFTSADFNEQRPLMDGNVLPYFNGVFFVEINFDDDEAYPESYASFTDSTTSPTERYLPLWTMDAVKFGDWRSIEGHMDLLPTKRHNVQIYGKGSWNATRVDEKKMVRLAVTA